MRSKICQICLKEYTPTYKNQKTCGKECRKVIISGKNNYFYGQHHTEETKKKMRKPKCSVNMHKSKSLEHRRNLSESRKKLYREGKINTSGKNNGMFGKIPWNKGIPRTIEEKRKISETKAKKYSKEYLKEIAHNARKFQVFPKKDSSIEIKIQEFLKQLNIQFFTHQYMDIEHGYQCDILIPSMRIVIECYGDYWHKIPYGKEIDSLRCQELRKQGFRVLIFWEREIKVMEINDLKEKLI